MQASSISNIVQHLRQDPLYYRNFGPYWWHVKRRIKAAGHTEKVLPHLGDYEDTSEEVTSRCDGKTPEELDNLALKVCAENSLHRRNNPHHLDEYGESYLLFDPDVGM